MVQMTAGETEFAKAMRETEAFSNTCRDVFKAAIGQSILPGGSGGLLPSIFGDSNSGDRERYGSYKAWLYSAVHALAMEAGAQPSMVGMLRSPAAMEDPNKRRRTKAMVKGRTTFNRRLKMPSGLRLKAEDGTLEPLDDHPLNAVLQQPNPIQTASTFVYMFVANICLTGWGYVIIDEGENGVELFAMPTSWVEPDHSKAPFSRFRIRDPKKAMGGVKDDDWIDGSKLAFAYLPNPADPMAALPPAGTQTPAIRIDNAIQTCQERFFKNGVFPSLAIAIGRDPHPDVQGGVRPRLSPAQRRQIDMVIRENMGGVERFGNPIILDGMIESITRVTPTQEEIGWEKSEEMVRNRILSAFGVHPMHMGGDVPVGGYAQAYIHERVFVRRINAFLYMLSEAVTRLVRANDLGDNLVVWWEEKQAVDESQYQLALREGRKNGDITRDEYRALALNLHPLEDEVQDVRAPLLDNAGGMTGIGQILPLVAYGLISRESAIAVFQQFFQLDREQAEAMVGDPVAAPMPGASGQPALPPPDDPEARAIGAARFAASILPPGTVADAIISHVQAMKASRGDRS